MPDFEREQWPVPRFGHRDAILDSVGWVVTYDDHLKETSRVHVPVEEVVHLPEAGLSGHVYLELVLARRLGVPARKLGTSN